jgi:hypothetical protein
MNAIPSKELSGRNFSKYLERSRLSVLKRIEKICITETVKLLMHL